MPCTVVLGCQWGDEGKGKIVDLLAEKADWVARFQGGANAGHTVYIDGKKAILHLIPTGILRPGVMCAIGNGVVMDPLSLLTEIRDVEGMNIPCRDRLKISTGVHLVTPLHGLVERFRQQDLAIGTTKRGIGPAYEDKAARRGMRGEDLIQPERFRDRLYSQWEFVQAMMGEQKLRSCAEPHWQRFEELLALLEAARAELAPMVCDVTDLLLTADDEGKDILCEGAQGTWLDIDHGTYPYVTSSNTSVGGVCTGLGIPPKRITKVIGIVKAYTTRVGHGPFPTEFEEGDWADDFRQQAGEFGATTGRPRRCGWFDAVLARRSVRINGIDELIVTKLDVLSRIDPLQIAISYGNRGGGGATRGTTDLEGVITDYVQMPGWEADLSESCASSEFPLEARNYLNRLSEAVGAPIGLVSIGPGREQVVAMNA